MTYRRSRTDMKRYLSTMSVVNFKIYATWSFREFVWTNKQFARWRFHSILNDACLYLKVTYQINHKLSNVELSEKIELICYGAANRAIVDNLKHFKIIIAFKCDNLRRICEILHVFLVIIIILFQRIHCVLINFFLF